MSREHPAIGNRTHTPTIKSDGARSRRHTRLSLSPNMREASWRILGQASLGKCQTLRLLVRSGRLPMSGQGTCKPNILEALPTPRCCDGPGRRENGHSTYRRRQVNSSGLSTRSRARGSQIVAPKQSTRISSEFRPGVGRTVTRPSTRFVVLLCQASWPGQVSEDENSNLFQPV